MDTWGIDGEDYIAAVRAGAIDPYGQSADDLQESLDAFDREFAARIGAMSDAEVEAAVMTGAPVPPLPREPQSPALERLRLDEEFVGRMVAIEAQSARVEGDRRALMAAHMQRVIDMAGDAGPKIKELAMMAAVELGLTGGGMAARMTDAWAIVTELPTAHAAAAEGRITVSHLRTIDAETRALRLDANVSPAERTRVIDELVEVAERTSTSQLRSRAKRIVNDVLTEPLQIRHETAMQKRDVALSDVGDGMGDLVARVPLLEGTAILDRLAQAARKKAKDDPRTFAQFRTDALRELLLAGVSPDDVHGTSSIRAHVSIAIPATGLLHDPDEQDPALQRLAFPAALDGKVLVDRDTARRIAGDTATWERLFTDPVTGVPVTVDSYRPTAAQRQWLRARDGTCRAPGCDRPVLRADLDHTRDFAKGGTTSLTNLEHLCRADHTFKHDTRWQLEQLSHGVLRWTSPIGQVITDEPQPAGPVFTDMPRTPPRPPKLSRAERRRQQREMTEQQLAKLRLPPDQRIDEASRRETSPTGWGNDAPDRSARPFPF